jgi:excisionase family DNA binding protein
MTHDDNQYVQPVKTYDINEAADFLKVDRSTALDLVGSGELPGAKIGRAWVFLESDLIDYLRDKVRRQTNERKEEAARRQRGAKDPQFYVAAPSSRRKRELPKLPELGSEVGATQISVAA